MAKSIGPQLSIAKCTLLCSIVTIVAISVSARVALDSIWTQTHHSSLSIEQIDRRLEKANKEDKIGQLTVGEILSLKDVPCDKKNRRYIFGNKKPVLYALCIWVTNKGADNYIKHYLSETMEDCKERMITRYRKAIGSMTFDEQYHALKIENYTFYDGDQVSDWVSDFHSHSAIQFSACIRLNPALPSFMSRPDFKPELLGDNDLKSHYYSRDDCNKYIKRRCEYTNKRWGEILKMLQEDGDLSQIQLKTYMVLKKEASACQTFPAIREWLEKHTNARLKGALETIAPEDREIVENLKDFRMDDTTLVENYGPETDPVKQFLACVRLTEELPRFMSHSGFRREILEDDFHNVLSKCNRYIVQRCEYNKETRKNEVKVDMDHNYYKNFGFLTIVILKESNICATLPSQVVHETKESLKKRMILRLKKTLEFFLPGNLENLENIAKDEFTFQGIVNETDVIADFARNSDPIKEFYSCIGFIKMRPSFMSHLDSKPDLKNDEFIGHWSKVERSCNGYVLERCKYVQAARPLMEKIESNRSSSKEQKRSFDEWDYMESHC